MIVIAELRVKALNCATAWSNASMTNAAATGHQTLDEALRQAEFEYAGVSSTWTHSDAVNT